MAKVGNTAKYGSEYQPLMMPILINKILMMLALHYETLKDTTQTQTTPKMITVKHLNFAST